MAQTGVLPMKRIEELLDTGSLWRWLIYKCKDVQSVT